MQLNQAIGIFSKLRFQANIHILKRVYHSLFETHLLSACQLWSQNNFNSPKQSTKKLEFQNRYESADPLYKNFEILKFEDLL